MNIETLKNKTLTRIHKDSDGVFFEDASGQKWGIFHQQECCESVHLEDVCGDLEDLVGKPLLLAEEVSSEGLPAEDLEYDKSFTWTFYKLATTKGYVTLRWYGTSNGYYSESAELHRWHDGDWYSWPETDEN